MSEQTTYDLPDDRLLRALDKAHEKGFRDFLRDNGHDGRCQAHRKQAANSLKNLINRLNKYPGPDYHDPYVAAAYIVKYHLWHCMMAYWVFKSIFDRIDIPDTLYVYDVAAGTGAGRVGLALALSEHQEQPDTYYTPSEPSKAMQSAGDCFWEAFRGFVGDNPKNYDSVPELPAGTLKFLAGTRDGAYDLMAQKLGCGRSDFEPEYLERYRQFFGVLDNKLRNRGLPPLGEGKDGFAPPF